MPKPKALKKPVQTIPDIDALATASDPSASAAALKELSRHADPLVVYQVAANPNTPEAILHSLWITHPLAAIENPLIAYKAFTSGESPHDLLAPAIIMMIYSALRQANRLDEIEQWAPEYERENRWFSYYSDRKETCETISDASFQRLLSHLATDPSSRVREAMVSRLDKSFLPIFAKDAECRIRLAVAKKLPNHSYYPDHESHLVPIAKQLAADPDEEVRLLVAACKCLTPSAHQRLAHDPSLAVRENLAAHGSGQDLEESGWRQLVSEGPKMCKLVASNTACPESIRIELTGHPLPDVSTLAWEHLQINQCTLPEKLAEKIEVLFADPARSPDRAVVAANLSITEPIIVRLMDCEPETTRILASSTALGDHHRSYLMSKDDEATACVAMQHSTSNELLRQGLAHPSPKVRIVLAGLPLPYLQDLRYKLAVDPAPAVREAVFLYITTHVQHHTGRKISEILTILSHDPLAKIRTMVIDDYRLPRKDVKRLGNDKSVRVRMNVLRRYCWELTSDYGLLDHKSTLVRCMAAEIIARRFNPRKLGDCLMSQLENKIAKDPSPKVRVIAATAYGTSARNLKRLILDPSLDVQRGLIGRYLPMSQRNMEIWINTQVFGILSLLERDRNPYNRAIAAASPRVGKRRTRRMMSDPCWYVRAMLAKNVTDLELLEILSKDKHNLVVEVATRRLAYFTTAYRPN